MVAVPRPRQPVVGRWLSASDPVRPRAPALEPAAGAGSRRGRLEQLDFVFASASIAERVSVRALNMPELHAVINLIASESEET